MKLIIILWCILCASLHFQRQKKKISYMIPNDSNLIALGLSLMFELLLSFFNQRATIFF